MTAPNFQALVAASVGVPVLTSAGALNNGTSSGELLQASMCVLGILDLETLNKVFNPIAEGNPVSSADTAATWLPTFNTTGFFGGVAGTTVTDAYWLPAFDGLGGGATYTPPVSNGMVTLQLLPAAKNTVEASSVMTYKVSPEAIVLLVPSNTAF
jgi:hypothetical protein